MLKCLFRVNSKPTRIALCSGPCRSNYPQKEYNSRTQQMGKSAPGRRHHSFRGLNSLQFIKVIVEKKKRQSFKLEAKEKTAGPVYTRKNGKMPTRFFSPSLHDFVSKLNYRSSELTRSTSIDELKVPLHRLTLSLKSRRV